MIIIGEINLVIYMRLSGHRIDVPGRTLLVVVLALLLFRKLLVRYKLFHGNNLLFIVPIHNTHSTQKCNINLFIICVNRFM